MSGPRTLPRPPRAGVPRLPGLLGLLALFLTACASVDVTPRALEESALAPEARDELARRWGEAVELANGFLASPYRLTLPAGRYTLAPDGMHLVTPERTWPVRVRCTTWGDLCVATGFAAQERTSGFVVGEVEPQGREPAGRAVDNSFFLAPDGSPNGPREMAHLLLHETTHQVHRVGTIGVLRTLRYYAIAPFTGGIDHPDEDFPHGTDEEFRAFWTGRRSTPGAGEDPLELLLEHAAREGGVGCAHGWPGDA